jgi:hypothetical protein
MFDESRRVLNYTHCQLDGIPTGGGVTIDLFEYLDLVSNFWLLHRFCVLHIRMIENYRIFKDMSSVWQFIFRYRRKMARLAG